jgi:hypothetical protein
MGGLDAARPCEFARLGPRVDAQGKRDDRQNGEKGSGQRHSGSLSTLAFNQFHGHLVAAAAMPAIDGDLLLRRLFRIVFFDRLVVVPMTIAAFEQCAIFVEMGHAASFVPKAGSYYAKPAHHEIAARRNSVLPNSDQ